MSSTLETLLAQAARAPSGDNTQPWRFVVDARSGTIDLELDPTRDPSPMNAGQRMARIAVGAALENLLFAARAQGWVAEPERPAAPGLARVRLARGGAGSVGDPGRSVAVLAARVTNRRPYDGRPVAAEVLDRLRRATPGLEETRTLWITARERIDALAAVIARADAVMFGEPFGMLRAFLKNVRFDAPPAAAVDQGLSLASLEVSAANRLALRAMPRLPDWVLRVAGVSRSLAANTRRLVRGSSGLCLVAAPDDAEATDVAVGRAMQRAWLALTEQGLAAQPMMSLPVLENALVRGDRMLREAVGPDRVRALREEFRAEVPELGDDRPAWLMRFGFAPSPSGRTGRRPLDAVTSYSPRPDEVVA